MSSRDAPDDQVIDTVQFDVEAGKVREFARATFTEDPIHTDRTLAMSTGFAGVPATATHTVASGHHRNQRAFVDALGLALERVVVGSVKWKYLRPLVAGDSLTGARRVVNDEKREGKRGGTMRVITLETEFVDAHGTVVARQQETIIERGDGS